MATTGDCNLAIDRANPVGAAAHEVPDGLDTTTSSTSSATVSTRKPSSPSSASASPLTPIAHEKSRYTRRAIT